MTHSDPVTPEVRDRVLLRDTGCVAQWLGFVHLCEDMEGNEIGQYARACMTLDHVQSGGGMMGKRAPSDPWHLVTLCAKAHLGGWATAHRAMLRSYISRMEIGWVKGRYTIAPDQVAKTVLADEMAEVRP
jgi:hypothetical protein